MNRSERRKAGIKTKEPVINIKVSEFNQYIKVTEFEKLKEELVNKGANRAFFLMLAIPVMIIHDKYGELNRKVVNGQCREERFANMIIELYNTFSEGYVSLDDLRQCLKEETGITVEKGL